MNDSKPRFSNRIYRAKLSRTDAGSPVVTIVAINPKGPLASYRQVSAFLYELAADMEKRSEELDARWAISPESWNARITVELSAGDDGERKAADQFIAQLLAGRNLG